jgi:hypothetical protein
VAVINPVTGFSNPESAGIKLNTVNVAELAPAGMVTVAGMPIWVPGMVVERFTTVLVADTPLRVTVPNPLAPILNVPGTTETLARTGTGGVTVRVAVTPGQAPVRAWMVLLIMVATVAVVTWNVATVEPCGMNMLLGPLTPAPV